MFIMVMQTQALLTQVLVEVVVLLIITTHLMHLKVEVVMVVLEL